MNTTIIEKLRKVLALTTSPSEGEAAAASKMLARLLAQHNLEIADLEAKGQTKQGVVEDKTIDLGKAAWAWKLQLANGLAAHFFCAVLTSNFDKNPRFVGRPDNVESLKMLYTWLIGQVQEISRTERRAHAERTGEHVDPLRWQLHFGVGVVGRLLERLEERRQQEATKAGTALVLARDTELSDFLEERYGYRTDGRKTKEEEEADRTRGERMAKWKAEDERLDQLKRDCEAAGDMEPYYAERPWERPLTEEQKKERDRANAKYVKECERRDKREQAARDRAAEREWARSQRPEEKRKRRQQAEAHQTGEMAADKINLEPFIECDDNDTKGAIQ